MKRSIRTYCVALSLGLLWLSGCSSEKDPEPVNCADSGLQIEIDNVKNVSDCLAKDGAVTASAQGGQGDLLYSVNGVDFQATGVFSGLSAGNYVVTVRDVNECEVTTSITIGVVGSSLVINSISTTSAGCDSEGGELVVNATGEGQLSYQLDNGTFQSLNTFSGLAAGTYKIVVKDEAGCQVFAQKTIFNGTSYEQQVKEIIITNCAIEGCHNGDQGANLNWNVFANVKEHADNIKKLTQNGDMPPPDSNQSLSQEEKDLIACWVEDGALKN
ncbi:hypothetical protein JMN32_22115 [Fulvivirga sp. 29W222]|uniref:SprB repeat-containing protein n=1 Tax=Fulvivirga marina TaxID=2494733 RepID=A0A937G1Z7_9BACT|nr:hypothetical protein [Fulvivirga marina]MBL6449023.1 hypothetical protein [Fulvivirga marina]